MEQVYASVLPSYVEVANKDFQMTLPYEIELGASGLQDVYVGFPGRLDGRVEGPIFEDGFRRIYPLQEPTPEAVMNLLSRYFTDFYAHLLGIKRSQVIPQSAINSYQLPPLQPDA